MQPDIPATKNDYQREGTGTHSNSINILNWNQIPGTSETLWLYYNQAAILCSLLQNIKENNLQFAGLIILLDLRMINSLCERY